jgi:hypothetical protein
MLNILFQIWTVLFYLSIAAIFYKVFEWKETKVVLAWPVRCLAISGLCLYAIGITRDCLNGKSTLSFDPLTLAALGIPLFATYVIFMLRYQYNDDTFLWFNGIYLRRIDAVSTSEIIFLSSKNSSGDVGRIRFIQGDSTKTMRNDLGVEDLVRAFAKHHGIAISQGKRD